MEGGDLKEANLQVEYRETISRLFIFRFLWVYILVWPMMVWAIWIAIIEFAHFWYMLILGKRSKTLWEKRVRFFRYLVKWQSYFGYVTDLRPKFIED